MDTLGALPSIFARNCIARRIDKGTADEFLRLNHRMGATSCRYRYGLFTRRSTGSSERIDIPTDTLVAVATFSSGRRMHGGSRSFEWIRYAPLEGCRVVGGMGKLLETFAVEVRPDDVMTYVDGSVSDGEAYRKLGFLLEATVCRAEFKDLKYRKRFTCSG